MIAIVVVVIAVVGVSFLFIVTVPVPVPVWADSPVTVAMAGLVQSEGHAERGREETNSRHLCEISSGNIYENYIYVFFSFVCWPSRTVGLFFSLTTSENISYLSTFQHNVPLYVNSTSLAMRLRNQLKKVWKQFGKCSRLLCQFFLMWYVWCNSKGN